MNFKERIKRINSPYLEYILKVRDIAINTLFNTKLFISREELVIGYIYIKYGFQLIFPEERNEERYSDFIRSIEMGHDKLIFVSWDFPEFYVETSLTLDQFETIEIIERKTNKVLFTPKTMQDLANRLDTICT